MIPKTSLLLFLVSAAAFPFSPLTADEKPAKPAGKIEYNRDIRPILAENCFACHGPDSASRKAALRVDRGDDGREARAIKPGNLKEGTLIERTHSDETDAVMPRPKTLKKRTPA